MTQHSSQHKKSDSQLKHQNQTHALPQQQAATDAPVEQVTTLGQTSTEPGESQGPNLTTKSGIGLLLFGQLAKQHQAQQQQQQQQTPFDDDRLNSVSGSLESVTSFAQTRVLDHKRPPLSTLRNETSFVDHKLSLEQVASKYESHLTHGLSKELAKIRLARNGPNSLSPPKPVSECYKFSQNLFSGFSLLLWVGAGLCIGAYAISLHIDHLILGFVLAAVVLINGLFSYYQENKSSRIMDSFKKLVPSFATVIRDGERDTIDASKLVLGDLVEVNPGDRVPADIRIVRSNQLRVDNSSLTGESEPQARSSEKTSDNPLETKNLAFYASNCVDGTGQGIVIATGDNTIMGNIAGLTAQLESNETPIAREIDHFVKIITCTACSIGFLFFALALANGYEWLEAVVFLIGIIVANVPEGLLATVTVCLTLTAKRMASRQCLVKNLEAVETLGSTSVICSDKTGTLTKNIMTVSHCWYDNHMFKCEVHDSRRIRLRDAHSLAWNCLTRAAKLCSRARFRPNQEKLPIRRRATTGDASESAILKWLESEFGGIVEYRDRQRKVAEIPFNSADKFALAIYEIAELRRSNLQLLHLGQMQAQQQQQQQHHNQQHSLSSQRGSQAGRSLTSRLSFLSGSRASSAGLNTRRTFSGGVDSHLSISPTQSGSLTARSSSRLGRLRGVQFHMGDEATLAVQTELDKLDKNCNFLLVIKGAPERVLERCESIVCANEVRPLDAKMREAFLRAYESMGGLGERVMGFADLPLDSKHYDEHFKFNTEQPNFPLRGFRFLGLISMIDPPRASVPDAVQKCREAGIRVIMVTGDHPITAQAIARSVGIISDSSEAMQDAAATAAAGVAAKRHSNSSGAKSGSGPAVAHQQQADLVERHAAVIHGNELREMTPSQLDEVLSTFQELVFARTSPQQKLAIVEACQRAGWIVAVTGDGVNDSPALKKADIGIAMGIMGSDVSKQAADMILLDDNFASIVHGIEEGRLIFDNLKKSIAYTIASNIPELVPFLIYIAFGIPLALGTVCILLIDLVTDMMPAISLAYEKAETDIMKRKPRNPKKERLVNLKLLTVAYGQVGVLHAIAGFFTYFVIFEENGWLSRDLVGIREKWDNSSFGDLSDSYGNSWDYDSRKRLEHVAATAFFVTIVVMQWGDLIISKTRKLSIVHQGMDNHVLNFALVFETVMTLVVCYVPGAHIFNLHPIRAIWWSLGLPFCLLLIICDEFRKWLIRRYPGGWMQRMTYY